MKHIPFLSLILLTAGASWCGAQEAPKSPRASETLVSDRARNGNELLADSLAQLAKQRTIKARMRLRTVVFGHDLVGEGEYLQMGLGDRPMLRVELKIPVADQVTSSLQVSSGRVLWTRREIGTGQIDLSRVDLDRIRDRIAERKNEPQVDLGSNWVVLGGLPRLIASLNHCFEFGEPRIEQLSEEPVWVTTGVWRPERLSSLVPHLKEEILARKPEVLTKLPRQIPAAVTVVLGRGESAPGFPYRVEYLHAEDPTGRIDAQSARPFLTLELFEVDFQAGLTAKAFDYRPPAAEQVNDLTEFYLRQIEPEARVADAETKNSASGKSR